MGDCFEDRKNESMGTTHGKNTGLCSSYSHSLATPHLQGGSVGSWQMGMVEDMSLLWV